MRVPSVSDNSAILMSTLPTMQTLVQHAKEAHRRGPFPSLPVIGSAKHALGVAGPGVARQGAPLCGPFLDASARKELQCRLKGYVLLSSHDYGVDTSYGSDVDCAPRLG